MARTYAPGYNVDPGLARSRLQTLSELNAKAGLRGVVHGVLEWLVVNSFYWPYHNGRRFATGNERFEYLSRPNHTERVIEIPWVIAQIPQECRSRAGCLEIGNTLNNWATFDHEVVDLYERAPNVTNADVESFMPTDKFPVVVSISTLEHVGLDVPVQDPGKFQRSVRNILDNCLAPQGRLLVTFPLGYNPDVDAFVLAGHFQLGELFVMVKDSVMNTWHEVSFGSLPEILRARPIAGHEYLGSNVIGFWRIRSFGAKS